MDKVQLEELINITYALTGQAQAYQANLVTKEDIQEQRNRLLNYIDTLLAQARKEVWDEACKLIADAGNNPANGYDYSTCARLLHLLRDAQALTSAKEKEKG